MKPFARINLSSAALRRGMLCVGGVGNVANVKISNANNQLPMKGN